MTKCEECKYDYDLDYELECRGCIHDPALADYFLPKQQQEEKYPSFPYCEWKKGYCSKQPQKQLDDDLLWYIVLIVCQEMRKAEIKSIDMNEIVEYVKKLLNNKGGLERGEAPSN